MMTILNARDEKPAKHVYTVKLREGKWAVEISPATCYGYYEHDEQGEGGGLWFEATTAVPSARGMQLTDYDGRFCLPKAVAKALRDAGYFLAPEFD